MKLSNHYFVTINTPEGPIKALTPTMSVWSMVSKFEFIRFEKHHHQRYILCKTFCDEGYRLGDVLLIIPYKPKELLKCKKKN